MNVNVPLVMIHGFLSGPEYWSAQVPFLEKNMQKPLNVCHLLTSLKVGGAERFVIDLSLEQIKMGKLSKRTY